MENKYTEQTLILELLKRQIINEESIESAFRQLAKKVHLDKDGTREAIESLYAQRKKLNN
jgi:DnaJ-class molecular chaperone